MTLENIIENLPQVSDFLTDYDEALQEMKKRRQNISLRKAVCKYLDGDIPKHFERSEIFFYMSRHLATPNFETIHAKHKANEYGVDFIVGEDLEDKFVSVNGLKKTLAKLSIETGIDKTGAQILRNHTIVDFSKNDGKRLKDVKTINGKQLHATHQLMLKEFDIEAIDESDWVERNQTTDMIKYYTRFLSLMVAHGIMLEFYAVEDVEFVEDVLRPAFSNVTKLFGCRPLICTILEPEQEFERNWLAYPKKVQDILLDIFDIKI